MALGTRRLEYRFVVPVETEPVETFENRIDRFLGRARLVCILDPEQGLAAMMAGKQPVEHRGPGSADVQEPCRRGREAGNDSICLFRLICSF